MRMAWFLFLSLWAAAAAGQTTAPTTVYKCVDERRQVTYSNTVCEKQGLRDAGPVADRTTSMPFTAPPKPAAAKDSATPSAAKDGAQVKPASPLIEKLLK